MATETELLENLAVELDMLELMKNDITVVLKTNSFKKLQKEMTSLEEKLDEIRNLKRDVQKLKLINKQSRDEVNEWSNDFESKLHEYRDLCEDIEAAIENVGKIEIYRLEKNISVLGTISGAAPMIGFFGTVIGMINAFIAISQEEGSVSPKLLSSGIYEAMITTAGGLFVGILAYICYNYLVRQVSEVIHKMEVTSIEFIDLLQKPN